MKGIKNKDYRTSSNIITTWADLPLLSKQDISIDKTKFMEGGKINKMVEALLKLNTQTTSESAVTDDYRFQLDDSAPRNTILGRSSCPLSFTLWNYQWLCFRSSSEGFVVRLTCFVLSDDASLRRMVYLFIKEVANNYRPDHTIVIC